MPGGTHGNSGCGIGGVPPPRARPSLAGTHAVRHSLPGTDTARPSIAHTAIPPYHSDWRHRWPRSANRLAGSAAGAAGPVCRRLHSQARPPGIGRIARRANGAARETRCSEMGGARQNDELGRLEGSRREAPRRGRHAAPAGGGTSGSTGEALLSDCFYIIRKSGSYRLHSDHPHEPPRKTPRPLLCTPHTRRTQLVAQSFAPFARACLCPASLFFSSC